MSVFYSVNYLEFYRGSLIKILFSKKKKKKKIVYFKPGTSSLFLTRFFFAAEIGNAKGEWKEKRKRERKEKSGTIHLRK